MIEAATYDAWEEDLATLNIYFGQETVMGEPEDANEQMNEPLFLDRLNDED